MKNDNSFEVDEKDPFAEFTPQATNEQAAKLEEAIAELQAIEAGLAKLKERMERGKQLAIDLTTKTIPDLMRECGCMEWKLANSGVRCTIKPRVNFSIPAPTTIAKTKDPDVRAQLEADRVAAMALVEKLAPSLVKRSFDVRFGKDERKLADKFERDLAQRKVPVPVIRSEKVEHQTMKAWLDKRAEKGHITEEEKKLFKLHFSQEAVITQE